MLFEELDPAGDLAKREPCLLLDEIGVVVGEPAGPGELVPQRQAIAETMPERGWCGHDNGLELVDRTDPVLAGGVVDDLQLADRLDAAVTALGRRADVTADPSSIEAALRVARPEITARAAATASMVSVLPSRRRALRSGRSTSITATPASVRCRVSPAPQLPVDSTPIWSTAPWLLIQAK